MKIIKKNNVLSLIVLISLAQISLIHSMHSLIPKENIDFDEFDRLADEFIELDGKKEHKKKYDYVVTELLNKEQKKLQYKESLLKQENNKLKEILKESLYIDKTVEEIIIYLSYNDTDDLPTYLKNIPDNLKLRTMEAFAQHTQASELILKNNCGALESFIESGLDIDVPFNNEKPLALIAGEKGCILSLKRLINAGANITCTNKEGRNPLQAYFEQKLNNYSTLNPFLLKEYIETRIAYRTNKWIEEYKDLKNQKFPDISKIPLYIRTNYDYKNGPIINYLCASENNNRYNNDQKNISAFVKYEPKNKTIIFWYNDKKQEKFEVFLYILEHEITHIIQFYNSFALKKIFKKSSHKKKNISKNSLEYHSLKNFNFISNVGLPDKIAHCYFSNINKANSWRNNELSEKEVDDISVKSETEADVYGIQNHPFPQEYYNELVNITKNRNITLDPKKGYIPFEDQKYILLRYFKTIKK